MSSLPLGALCHSCGRRSILFHGEVEDLKGNMKELRSLKLQCINCGGRTATAFVFRAADQVSAFTAGAPIPTTLTGVEIDPLKTDSTIPIRR